MFFKNIVDIVYTHYAVGYPSDVSAVLHYLVGNYAQPKILNLKAVDVSHLFEYDPSPSGVAATLVKFTKNSKA